MNPFNSSTMNLVDPTFETVKLTNLTDGYLPKHTSDAVGLANSPIYTNGTNVGIGANSPRSLMDITSGLANTDGNTSNGINVTAPNLAMTSSNVNLQINTNDAQAADVGGSIGLGGLYRTTARDNITYAIIKGAKLNATNATYSGYLAFGTRNHGNEIAERARLDNLGKFGVGTATPASTISSSGNLSVGANYAAVAAPTNGAIFEGNVGVGTSSPNASLQVKSDTNKEIQIGTTTSNYTTSTYFTDLTATSSLINFSRPSDGVFVNSVFSYNASTYCHLGLAARHDFVFVCGELERLRLTSAGLLKVVSLAGTGNRAVYSDASGNLTNSSSDENLKTNISNLTYGLSQVLAMRPIFYNWINPVLGDQREIGFVAQEIEKIIPEVVGINSNGMKSLDYPKLVAVMAMAIQELNVKLEAYING
jgi:hypothetical protein